VESINITNFDFILIMLGRELQCCFCHDEAVKPEKFQCYIQEIMWYVYLNSNQASWWCDLGLRARIGLYTDHALAPPDSAANPPRMSA